MLGKNGRRVPKRDFRPNVSGLEHRWLQTTVPSGYSVTTIGQGLAKPTVLVITPDGRLFVAQKYGQIKIIQGGRIQPTPLLKLKVDSAGEGGLVGLALDPKFPKSPWLYAYYTVPAATRGGHPHNRVSRFLVKGNVADPSSEQVLLNLPPRDSPSHNGGSLTFGKDGKLFIGVGDNYHKERAQALNNPFGKILRINSDGSIPKDNPFYTTQTGINRAIWAYGLRNPFSTAVDRRSGRFLINDVGQDTWEEIDVGVKGANYGWPKTEGPTTAPGIRGPLFAYRHGDTPETGAAITGAAFDNSTRPLTSYGSYYFSDVTGNFIRRLTPDGKVHPFATGLPYITTDLKIDSKGTLYVVSEGDNFNTGRITVISRRR